MLIKTQVSFLGCLCSAATLRPRFRTPTFRPYRAAMYACLGLSALVSITHAIILHGWEESSRRMSLGWMGLMAALNLIGALIYAARVSPRLSAVRGLAYTENFQIPERLFQRRFDTFGSSHQILHFMVIFAGLAHMHGLFKAFDYAHRVSHSQLQNHAN